MPDRPKTLVLAPEVPFPVIGGGALRTASILHYLACRSDVDLVVFQQPGAVHPAERVPAGLIRRLYVITLPFHSRGGFSRAARNLKRLVSGTPPLIDRFAGFESRVAAFAGLEKYEIGLVEHFWCAPYQRVLAPRCNTTVLDLHNIESLWHERCGAVEQPPVRLAFQRFAKACRRLEREWLPRYSTVLTVSENDAAAAAELSPRANIAMYPNTIPWEAAPSKEKMHAVVFTGNIEYRPNRTGLDWFCREIWPQVRELAPHAEVWIAGMNAGQARTLWAGVPGLRIFSDYEDAVGLIASAKVAVVPIRAASGSRFKILEAWAAGVPVVSTTIGAEGLSAEHGRNIVIADDPEPFARAVSRLLSDDELRVRIGAEGRSLFEAEYTWEHGWAHLNRILTL